MNTKNIMRAGGFLFALLILALPSRAQTVQVCPGGEVILTLSGYTGTIQWQMDTVMTGSYNNMSGVTGDSASYFPQMSGYVRAQVTDGTCDPFYSDTLFIEVLPGVNADAGMDMAICSGEMTTIGGSPAGSGGSGSLTYMWAPSASLSADSVGNPTAMPTLTTDYVLTVTDSLGCMAMDTVTVTVNDRPMADAGADTSVNCGDTAPLNGSASMGSAPYTYHWSPGTGVGDSTSASTTSGPIYGGATYVLTVTDANGCMDMDSVMMSAIGGSSGVDSFAYTGVIDTSFVIPCADSIVIEVWGAQGGYNTTSSVVSGLGAYQKGTFTSLPVGQKLKILVGEQPSLTTGNGNGGGGGSFVTLTNNSPVIIAGGGGGSSQTTDSPNKHGQAGTTGGTGAAGGGAGGTAGSGGSVGASGFQSGAGGGLLTDGADGWTSNTGGDSFLNGGAGATANGNARGGFGGGGSGSSYVVGGGGGGYSGGGSGGNSSAGVGGGGGSYNSGANPTSTSGVQSGHGKVKITWY